MKQQHLMSHQSNITCFHFFVVSTWQASFFWMVNNYGKAAWNNNILCLISPMSHVFLQIVNANWRKLFPQQYVQFSLWTLTDSTFILVVIDRLHFYTYQCLRSTLTTAFFLVNCRLHFSSRPIYLDVFASFFPFLEWNKKVKNSEKAYFNQQTRCAAPIFGRKYTTCNPNLFYLKQKQKYIICLIP